MPPGTAVTGAYLNGPLDVCRTGTRRVVQQGFHARGHHLHLGVLVAQRTVLFGIDVVAPEKLDAILLGHQGDECGVRLQERPEGFVNQVEGIVSH
jgi:hypothetical protein